MLEIETTRLRLRMLSPEDADDLSAIFADPEVVKFLGVEAGITLSRSETESALEGMIACWKRNEFGRWAVIEKESGKLVGLCGIRLLEGAPELFYLFAKESWGRGFATEAAAAALRDGFERLQFERIIAVTRPGNTASIKVLTKIGMRFEKEVKPYGVDGVRYVTTRSEFQTADSIYFPSS